MEDETFKKELQKIDEEFWRRVKAEEKLHHQFEKQKIECSDNIMENHNALSNKQI
jgi:hypothetical protein